MGQEQSTQVPPTSTPTSSDGVRLVQEVRTDTTAPSQGADRLLDDSSALPLPHPLLPPAPIKDDVSSALQGAHVMHELRSVLGGLLLRSEHTAPRSNPMALQQPQSHPPSADGEQEDDDHHHEEQRNSTAVMNEASSIDQFSVATLSEEDTRAEQERWARLGIDYEAVSVVMNECTGGDRLTRLLARQEELLDKIKFAAEKSLRLGLAMDTNGEQAKRTTKALEGLDRIHVALADVQDSLEAAVATANILGASHFSHDDEMCSFKNFLKHNPPGVP